MAANDGLSRMYSLYDNIDSKTWKKEKGKERQIVGADEWESAHCVLQLKQWAAHLSSDVTWCMVLIVSVIESILFSVCHLMQERTNV